MKNQPVKKQPRGGWSGGPVKPASAWPILCAAGVALIVGAGCLFMIYMR